MQLPEIRIQVVKPAILDAVLEVAVVDAGDSIGDDSGELFFRDKHAMGVVSMRGRGNLFTRKQRFQMKLVSRPNLQAALAVIDGGHKCIVQTYPHGQ